MVGRWSSKGTIGEQTLVDEGLLQGVDRPLSKAKTLPGPLFYDPRVYDLEIRRLFHRSWQCIAREDDLREPGDYLTVEVGGSGVLLVRGKDGRLGAFHNVCRHRGTRLVETVSGRGMAVLRCPYHAWSYDLNGSLLAAPHMDGIEDFHKQDSGLLPVALESWRGFVFVNLDRKARPLRAFLGEFTRRAAPYPLERLRRARRVVYDINANWKLVVQNADECYHCAGVHPQLHRITPYTSGDEDMTSGPIFGGWMDLNEGFTTLTPSGATSRATFQRLSPEDLRRVYYYFLYPANFISLLPDYITWDWFIPQAPDRTRVIFDIFVDAEAADPADDAMDFWEMTNCQDWHICELAHQGSRTVGYVQGRYSQEEELVHAIDRHYLREMGFTDGGRRGRGRGRRTGP